MTVARTRRPTTTWTARSHVPGRQRAAGDHGQAVPLLLGVLAVGMVFLVSLARVGVAAVEAARARTAADAAALAGALAGRGAAAGAAQDNGGSLVSFAQVDTDVVVTVRVGEASAQARARLIVAGPGP